MIDSFINIAALVLIVPGIAMAFIPMLPALTYMFVIALIYGFVDKFQALSIKELLVLLALVIVGFIIDHTSGLIGAKYGGAHTKSLLWGMLGAFIGTFFLPPISTFVGLFLGVFLAEIRYKKSNEMAFKAASGALVGTAVGVAVNIMLACLFTGLFVWFVFF
jgi:uncharacterized protein YqgC (DUF456 family)